MGRRRLLAAALVATFVGSCRCGGEPATRREAPRPIALVNGEPIPAAALERELARGGAEGSSAFLRRRILDEAVDRIVLLQQARARSASASDEQVDRAFQAIQAEYPGTHLDDLLGEEHLSAAELKARLREQLTIQGLFASDVFPSIQISDAELQRYYSERGADFDQPDEVHALQVVVPTKEEAQKIREELRRHPQSFGEVAKRTSIAPEGRRGGDLGWFGKGSGMPEVFDVCFKLPQNTISEVTPSPYGFHIFKVLARRAASRRPFAEVRSLIEERLLREKRARAQQEYLAALRSRAKIEIDEKALEAVVP